MLVCESPVLSFKTHTKTSPSIHPTAGTLGVLHLKNMRLRLKMEETKIYTLIAQAAPVEPVVGYIIFGASLLLLAGIFRYFTKAEM